MPTKGQGHEEKLVKCSKCGAEYCAGCDKFGCPKCGEIHFEKIEVEKPIKTTM